MITLPCFRSFSEGHKISVEYDTFYDSHFYGETCMGMEYTTTHTFFVCVHACIKCVV